MPALPWATNTRILIPLVDLFFLDTFEHGRVICAQFPMLSSCQGLYQCIVWRKIVALVVGQCVCSWIVTYAVLWPGLRRDVWWSFACLWNRDWQLPECLCAGFPLSLYTCVPCTLWSETMLLFFRGRCVISCREIIQLLDWYVVPVMSVRVPSWSVCSFDVGSSCCGCFFFFYNVLEAFWRPVVSLCQW